MPDSVMQNAKCKVQNDEWQSKADGFTMIYRLSRCDIRLATSDI